MAKSRCSPTTSAILTLGIVLFASAPAWAEEFDDHIQRAREHYDARRYAASILELKAAYALRPLPRIHFDLAQAYRSLGHKEDALGHYELFLRTDPDIPPELRAKAEGHIARLRPPPAPPPLPVAVPPPRTPIHRRWWLWTAVGAVAAGAAVGIAVGVTRGPRLPGGVDVYEPQF